MALCAMIMRAENIQFIETFYYVVFFCFFKISYFSDAKTPVTVGIAPPAPMYLSKNFSATAELKLFTLLSTVERCHPLASRSAPAPTLAITKSVTTVTGLSTTTCYCLSLLGSV